MYRQLASVLRTTDTKMAASRLAAQDLFEGISRLEARLSEVASSRVLWQRAAGKSNHSSIPLEMLPCSFHLRVLGYETMSSLLRAQMMLIELNASHSALKMDLLSHTCALTTHPIDSEFAVGIIVVTVALFLLLSGFPRSALHLMEQTIFVLVTLYVVCCLLTLGAVSSECCAQTVVFKRVLCLVDSCLVGLSEHLHAIMTGLGVFAIRCGGHVDV